MSRILAVVLMLVPMMISAQEWMPTGISRGGWMITNGQYIASYPFDSQEPNRIGLVLDAPNGPQVLIDTIFGGELRDVAFIGNTLWVVADSVFSIDPVTRTVAYEGFSNYMKLTPVKISSLPGGIGIAVGFGVWFRADGSMNWEKIADVPAHLTEHALVGTDDGFLLVATEPADDMQLYPMYAVRFTMDGQRIGDSILIGDQFPRNELSEHGLVRQGANIYFTTYEGANAVSTDQGATWSIVSSPLKRQSLTSTPSSLWWPADSLVYFSDPLSLQAHAYAIPPIGESGFHRQAFCLDHSCYTVTELGISYITRPTVGVDENTDRPSPSTSNATTAQLINVLGELVGTLTVVDGQLAPFDPTTLPMQVLWAVWGEKVVRVR